MEMDRRSFEGLVEKALDELPGFFRERFQNVAVVVEEWADQETLRRAGVQHRAQLLGFYHGVPLTKRTHRYTLVLPDKISVYRQPILMRCRSRAQVRALVRSVLRHELAHHLGIDDDRLRQLGAY